MDSNILKNSLISAGVGATASATISLSMYLANRRRLVDKLKECKTPLCKNTIIDAMDELKSSALKLGLLGGIGSGVASAAAPSVLKALTGTSEPPQQKYYRLPSGSTDAPTPASPPVIPPSAIVPEQPKVLKVSTGVRRVSPNKGITDAALDNIVTPKEKIKSEIKPQELKQPRKNDQIHV